MASLGGCQTTQMHSNSSTLGGTDNLTAAFGAASQPQLALLDLVFPGFSIITSAIQRYLGIDLNLYIPLVAVLGGLVASWQYFSNYSWRQIETYFMSTVDIRIDDEIYNMLMAWVADQRFAKKARRFVANTNLNSRSWFLWRWDDDDDDEDDNGDEERTRMSLVGGKKKKALAYTPTFGSHYFTYKGRLCIFRRDRGRDQGGGFFLASEKEEISVSCFGRDPWALKELLLEARAQFMQRDEAKTLIYRGMVRAGSTDPTWQRVMARVSRPFSTVILNEKVKQDLIDDVTDYLNPATRRWYANRGIPYRRGYLLYGPPGTGKSSLSLALAGFFKMRIYIVSLSSISSTEETIASLFAELPRRCVVLLEDIDTAGLTHTREEDGTQNNGGNTEEITPKQGLRGNDRGNNTTNNNSAFRLSLSGLLNILDGVASQEGRVLIMTTNHLEKLDKALIRPGRVDMTVQFGLADTGMIASIFRAIFAPLEADSSSFSSTSAKLAKLAKPTSTTEVTKARDAAEVLERTAAEKVKREEMIARVERLAEEFASKVPSHEFSPAELQGLLMKNKRDPEAAVAGAELWVTETRKEKAANKLKEAEEKRKKEEDEEKKKKDEEEKKKAEKKSKRRGDKNSKRRSRKSKKDESSSTESESAATSSESESASDSESGAEKRRKSRKSKSKAKKPADIKTKVDKAADEGERNVEPVSAASTAKSDSFVDIKKEECAEEARPKAVGSDSGYSTP